MTLLQSIVLGLVQGITEFLPISSSGHLILARKYLGIADEMSLPFDVMLHMATLLAILIYYYSDIRDLLLEVRYSGIRSKAGKTILAIIVGSVPAGLAGFLWADWLEAAFRNPTNVAYSLILGSVVFFAADWYEKSHKTSDANVSDGEIGKGKGFLIGLFQAGALIPGMSRSGLSISGGLFTGLSREEAIRFAFLLGIPTIAGAGLKTILDIKDVTTFLLDPYIYTGAAAAFLAGIVAIRFLVRFLSRNSFNVFVAYRILLALTILKLL